MSPDALERPCLVGPRNETVDERVDPIGGSRNEQIGRSLWKASDGTVQSLPKGVNNDEDVGPLGESRDDEDVGPLGELREDDDVGPLEEPRDEEEVEHLEKLSDIEEKFRQDVEKFAQKVEEDFGVQEDEEKVADAENMSVLMQFAAKSAGTISGTPAVTEDASSPPTATTFPSEPQTPLSFSYSQLTSTPPTASRKRSRDAEEDARDEDSLSQQKRLRMDDVFGIVRKDAGTARVSHIVREAVTPDIRQSRKRSRSPDDGSEDGEDGATKPTPKHLRLYQQLREICEVEEEYVGAGPADTTRNGHSTLVYQDVASSEAQEADFINKATTDIKAREEYFVEEEKFANDEAVEREDTRTEDEAASTQTEWNTAHGINSDCANVRVPKIGIFDLTGEWTKFYLPTSRGLLDRPWTEEEKEDLRAYIQDYRIEDWAALSQSTNRTETNLQGMFLEVIAARNKKAGRPERDGIPDRYPNLAPPPPPVPVEPPISAEPAAPAAPATPEEPRKLRAESLIGKSKKNSLGDLTYDVKATSFPRTTRDERMVDSEGNVLHGSWVTYAIAQSVGNRSWSRRFLWARHHRRIGSTMNRLMREMGTRHPKSKRKKVP